MSQVDLQWFAPEDEGKTEKPTETRIRKAREEGRVAKSQELNGAVVLLITVILLVFMSPWLLTQFKEFMIFYFNNATASKVNDARFYVVFITFFVKMVLPITAAGILGAVIANLIQNRGFLFTTKTIWPPKFNKLIPKFGEYFKRTLFSKEGLFNIAKSILKVAIISVVAFTIIRSELPVTLEFLHTSGPEAALRQIGGIVARLLLICSVVLLAISVLDYFVQRSVFMDSLKMSKQEVKEEFKEMEGDPQVKGHLEQAQKEMLRQNLPKAVRESDVVIANPTHFAVALQYKAGVDYAPKVSAKGEDLTAQNIKRIAKENEVPVVENMALARTLYYELDVGSFVPEKYLQTIATIYAEIAYMSEDMKKQYENVQA